MSIAVLELVWSLARRKSVRVPVALLRNRENVSTSMNVNMERISAVTHATTPKEASDVLVPKASSCRKTERRATTSMNVLMTTKFAEVLSATTPTAVTNVSAVTETKLMNMESVASQACVNKTTAGVRSMEIDEFQ